MIERITVGLGHRSYDILVGNRLLPAAGRYLADALGQRHVVVVTDATLAALHLGRLEGALAAAGHTVLPSVVVGAGEATKCFSEWSFVVESLLDRRPDRQTVVVALGGGVIGDLAGFAAAVTLRGLPFMQVPTTLLAQVDSSVGGKTGINTRHGKNLVGAFHQPRLVLADLDVLRTLPRRDVLAGYAEVVKYGLLGDAALFGWLEMVGERVCALDPEPLRRAVVASCRAKADIVAADEREAGQRALLNLGHTFGHALEAVAGYGETLLHGEAVAIGMVMAFGFSARRSLVDQATVARVRGHLERVGLPVAPNQIPGLRVDAERLVEAMRHDKKLRDGRMTFVLVRGIGEAFVAVGVADEEVRDYLHDSLGPPATG